MGEKVYAIFETDIDRLALVDGRVHAYWRKHVAEAERRQFAGADHYDVRRVVVSEDKPKRKR